MRGFSDRARNDVYGMPIERNGRHRTSFRDHDGSGILAEEVHIVSYKDNPEVFGHVRTSWIRQSVVGVLLISTGLVSTALAVVAMLGGICLSVCGELCSGKEPSVSPGSDAERVCAGDEASATAAGEEDAAADGRAEGAGGRAEAEDASGLAPPSTELATLAIAPETPSPEEGR